MDVLLVGAGIMSATLAVLLKELDPSLKLEIAELRSSGAIESSNPWNNAGTGHAGLCELNYTPQAADGSIDIKQAVQINAQFEVSKQFWSHLAGKPAGYLERQVRRWGSQWQHVRLPDDPRDTDVRRLHTRLTESVPPESRSSIVHGDYRIDNTMLDSDDPRIVRAVLDWEMSTLGDPLSDVAVMVVQRDPTLNTILGMQAAWSAPTMPSQDDLAHRYAVASGHPLAHWDFQMALGYFKLGIIVAGIEFRARMAAQSDPSAAEEPLGQAVAVLISAGLAAIG